MTTTKRAIGYVRVSTEQQASEGASLDAQRAQIEAYCSLYGFELVGIEVDAGLSASTLNRPGLQSALAMLDNGNADALVVVKLDRLTRSVTDLGGLIDTYFKKRFDLVSVAEQVDTTNATGRLVLNILMSVSQWEREAIGERTSAVMQHKIAQGEYTGGNVRYGYKVASCGVKLIEDEDEQEVIAIIRELRATGLSLRKISAELASRGVVNRSGKAFAHNAISKLVA